MSSARLLCGGGLRAGDSRLSTPCRWVACLTAAWSGARSGLSRSGSPEAAFAESRQRLFANPAAAGLWLETGREFFSGAQTEKARYCFERSVELAPQSPPVLVEAAAFLLATGNIGEGLDLLARALALTRAYDAVIFPLYDRVAGTPAILERGLPLHKQAAQAYFIHLLAQDQPESALLTWQWLARHEFADGALIRRYLIRLLDDDRGGDAAHAARNFLPTGERPADANRINHGGFEAEPSVPPLDWIVTPTPHAQVRREDSTAWEGAWSLRIEFDGQANIEYRHVAQQVVLAPGRWKLSAHVRTAGVTTDQGVGMRVFDARSASRWQIGTETVRGDSGWRRIETTFKVPAFTRLVQLEIVRRPSSKLDNKLGGIAWIDAVSLKPL